MVGRSNRGSTVRFSPLLFNNKQKSGFHEDMRAIGIPIFKKIFVVLFQKFSMIQYFDDFPPKNPTSAQNCSFALKKQKPSRDWWLIEILKLKKRERLSLYDLANHLMSNVQKNMEIFCSKALRVLVLASISKWTVFIQSPCALSVFFSWLISI